MGMELEKYADAMAKCSHCAFCQAGCPVFKEDLLETHMPRARMDLIRASLLGGEMALTRRARSVVDRCLLCGTCSRTCPAQVPVDDVVIAARARIYGAGRKGLVDRLFRRSFMEGRGLSGPALLVARAARGRGWVASEIPPFADEPLSATILPGELPFEGDRRARAAYFTGCATNSGYTDTGRDALFVLAKNGVQVVIPEGIACCGMPALAEGDVETARAMAEKNVAALKDIEADFLVTDCTTCGLMFAKKIPALLGPEHPLFADAMKLAGKTREVTDFLAGLGLSATPGPLEETLTYHVPCHGNWTPTLADAPRAIFSQIPGVNLVEMDRPDACCGAGGGFFLDERQLAVDIREKKLANLKETGAGIIATQCPSCRGFLADPLPGVRVVHPVSVLARALAGRIETEPEE